MIFNLMISSTFDQMLQHFHLIQANYLTEFPVFKHSEAIAMGMKCLILDFFFTQPNDIKIALRWYITPRPLTSKFLISWYLELTVTEPSFRLLRECVYFLSLSRLRLKGAGVSLNLTWFKQTFDTKRIAKQPSSRASKSYLIREKFSSFCFLTLQ